MISAGADKVIGPQAAQGNLLMAVGALLFRLAGIALDREMRDAVQAALKEKGIPSMVYYPKPMHDQQAFGIEGEYGFDCSNTAELCGTVLSLPMHPYMSDEDIKEVVDALKEALK